MALGRATRALHHMEQAATVSRQLTIRQWKSLTVTSFGRRSLRNECSIWIKRGRLSIRPKTARQESVSGEFQIITSNSIKRIMIAALQRHANHALKETDLCSQDSV